MQSSSKHVQQQILQFFLHIPLHLFHTHSLKEKEENRNQIVLRKKTFLFLNSKWGLLLLSASETPIQTIYTSKKNKKRTPFSLSLKQNYTVLLLQTILVS